MVARTGPPLLLAVSPAGGSVPAAHRRHTERPHQAGRLLKRRSRSTFAGGTTCGGLLEADLVAAAAAPPGAFLYTLTLTDVATAGTSACCWSQPARRRRGFDRARLLPFPCWALTRITAASFSTRSCSPTAREQVTFTRGRTANSNDQCFVEQKNGSIVRHLVGYDS